jgi:hypothetical protein
MLIIVKKGLQPHSEGLEKRETSQSPTKKDKGDPRTLNGRLLGPDQVRLSLPRARRFVRRPGASARSGGSPSGKPH